MAGKKKAIEYKKHVYPILFMIVLASVFTILLASINEGTKTRIQQYNKLSLRKKVLDLYNLKYDDPDKIFNQNVVEKSNNGKIYYQVSENNMIKGYCFLINGNGLWGKINAILAVDKSYKKILGFDLISQNETPGLGGRITETWFKKQFVNKKIFDGSIVTQFSLVAEESVSQDNQINQITGATLSSKAVTNMITSEFKQIINDLGLKND